MWLFEFSKSLISKILKSFTITKWLQLQIGPPWPLTSFCRFFNCDKHRIAGDIFLKQNDEKLWYSLFWMGSYVKSTLRKIYKKSCYIRCFIVYMYSIPPNGPRIDVFKSRIMCRLTPTIDYGKYIHWEY